MRPGRAAPAMALARRCTQLYLPNPHLPSRLDGGPWTPATLWVRPASSLRPASRGPQTQFGPSVANVCHMASGAEAICSAGSRRQACLCTLLALTTLFSALSAAYSGARNADLKNAMPATVAALQVSSNAQVTLDREPRTKDGGCPAECRPENRLQSKLDKPMAMARLQLKDANAGETIASKQDDPR
ncbi:hypothetical protein PSPO01_07285 [Paraphaeosphaeria sporulosa]